MSESRRHHLGVRSNSKATTASPNGSAARARTSFELRCPSCRSRLRFEGLDTLACPVEGHLFQRRDDVWHFLTPDRDAYYEQFNREYLTVRRAEGRGGASPNYYRALPRSRPGERFSRDWAIRAQSYETFVRRVLIPIELRSKRPLKILDLGAGTGWLAYRMRKRGHAAAAVDLSTDQSDGLGAKRHYELDVLAMQAEFDRLPIADDEADIVVFNASLHYSIDFRMTLSEALRVLRPDGALVVLDTAIYRDPNSGRQMLAEREADFTRRFGFPSNSIPSEGFLTYERLRELGDNLGITWQMLQPRYGLRWALRPWRARLRRRREPAAFSVIVGRRGAPSPAYAGDNRATKLGRQLIRGVVRTRYQLFERRRFGRHVLEEAIGSHFMVLPDVFNPVLFRTGEFLANSLNQTPVPPEARVLDLGTGSGISAVVAARQSEHVVAVDINPEAVRCARINALLNHVEHRVSVRHGDLFDAVNGERFDIVLFNPPFFPGAPGSLFDLSWRSDDVAERFAGGLGEHLAADGFALVVLSSHGEPERFLAQLHERQFRTQAVATRDLLHERLVVYRVHSARQ